MYISNNHNSIKKKQNGFIHIIVIFVMAIIILSLLGVNLDLFFKNEILRSNFKLAWDVIKSICNKYLTEPSQIVWNYFIVKVWMPVYGVIKEKL